MAPNQNTIILRHFRFKTHRTKKNQTNSSRTRFFTSGTFMREWQRDGVIREHVVNWRKELWSVTRLCLAHHGGDGTKLWGPLQLNAVKSTNGGQSYSELQLQPELHPHTFNWDRFQYKYVSFWPWYVYKINKKAKMCKQCYNVLLFQIHSFLSSQLIECWVTVIPSHLDTCNWTDLIGFMHRKMRVNWISAVSDRSIMVQG